MQVSSVEQAEPRFVHVGGELAVADPAGKLTPFVLVTLDYFEPIFGGIELGLIEGDVSPARASLL